MPAPTPEENLGKTIGSKYLVLRILGRGGMGVVYQARHTMTGREVALKLLLPEHSANPAIAQRFLTEAQAAGQLRHPHVVEILDMGQEADGTVFMVMELLTGESLGDTLRRGPIEVTSAVRLLDPILDALAAAHRAGVVHRDIKPDNIFFNRQGAQVIPKIVDFGLAKVIDSAHQRLTRTGTAMGTPWYMAPEQIRDSKNATPPVDVWAFAMVFYLAVTKKRPYAARSAVQILKAILTEAPRPLEEADPSLPPGVCAAIRDALHRDPSQRPDALLLASQLRVAVGLPAAGPLRGQAQTGSPLALPPPDITQPLPATQTDPHWADLDAGSGGPEPLPGTATLPDLPQLPGTTELESNPELLLQRLREEQALDATTLPMGRPDDREKSPVSPPADSPLTAAQHAAPTIVSGPPPASLLPPGRHEGSGPTPAPPSQAQSAQSTLPATLPAQSKKLVTALVVVVAVLAAVIAVLVGALLSLASG